MMSGPLDLNAVRASIATANTLKAEGNELFKAREFQRANGKYTRMLAYLTGLDPDVGAALAGFTGAGGPGDALQGKSRLPPALQREVSLLRLHAHNNSAACYTELGQPAQAAAAATKALTIDAANAKARMRRAAARLQLGDVAGAHEDVAMLPETAADERAGKQAAQLRAAVAARVAAEERALQQRLQKHFAAVSIGAAAAGAGAGAKEDNA